MPTQLQEELFKAAGAPDFTDSKQFHELDLT
jgi:hypothetical protein